MPVDAAPRRAAALRLVLCLALTACAGDSSDDSGPVPDVPRPTTGRRTSLRLGNFPEGLAISPANVFAVIHQQQDSLQFGTITGNTEALGAIGNVGLQPVGAALTIDGTKAYSANVECRCISILNTSTGARLKTLFPRDDVNDVLITPDGGRVFVTSLSGRLYEVDPGIDELVDTMPIPTQEPRGMAWDAVTGTLYIAAADSARVIAFDPDVEAVERTYETGSLAADPVLAPDGTTLYVRNGDTGVDEIDLATGARIDLPVGPGFDMALTPDGVELWVVEGSRVAVFDTETRTVSRLIEPFANARHIAFTANGKVAVVTAQGNFSTIDYRVWFIR